MPLRCASPQCALSEEGPHGCRRLGTLTLGERGLEGQRLRLVVVRVAQGQREAAQAVPRAETCACAALGESLSRGGLVGSADERGHTARMSLTCTSETRVGSGYGASLAMPDAVRRHTCADGSGQEEAQARQSREGSEPGRAVSAEACFQHGVLCHGIDHDRIFHKRQTGGVRTPA